MIEFVLFLPQMRLSFDELVVRARAAEAGGFVGIAGMDHLAPPMAEGQPMYDAMITAAMLAAHTTTLRVGSLVMGDAFRHPAVLAKEVVSVDHASGGRFELGIGAGSVVAEFEMFGVAPTATGERVSRLRETLDVLRALWSGERVDYDGRFHHLAGAQQQPTPLGNIPIVIGGTGPRMMTIVRDFADWWNVPLNQIDQLDAMRPDAGAARVSIQEVVGYVNEESAREDIASMTRRRFSYASPTIGAAAELVDHYGGVAARGIERVYVWFSDFAAPDTLGAFGERVIAQLR